MANFFDQFDAPKQGGNFFDQFDGAPQQDDFATRFQPASDAPLKVRVAPGMLEQAMQPITSYPETYAQMNRESRDLMSEGVNQMGEGGVGNVAIGAGKTALGGLGYVTSPINAALRTVVGQPIQNNTGIPREYTEFAAGMALPIPSRIPIPSRAPRAVGATSEELGQAASNAYRAARDMGVEFRPMPIAHEAAGIESRLLNNGFAPDNAPLTMNALRSLQNVPQGAKITATDLERLRQRLNVAARTQGPDSAAAHQAIGHLEDYLANIPRGDVLVGDADEVAQMFRQARGDYAAARRTQMVEGRQDLAELNAATANSGMNVDNANRQAVKSLIRPNMRGVSPAEKAGFNQAEIDQARRVAEGSRTQNAARLVGNVLGGGGGLGALHAASVGAAAGYAAKGVGGAVLGAMAPIVGNALRRISAYISERETQRLVDLVSSRSPYARRVNGPLNSYAQAAQAFQTSPSTRSLARLSIASRNLSHNLADFGITASPENLIRAIQGPMRGATEDEQPKP